MRLHDASFCPVGVFRLQVFQLGRLVETVCERNLWVNAGSTNTARMYGAGSAGAITQIGFGTNGTAPALTDTALTGAFLEAVGAVTYPAPGQVSWAFTLAATAANGLAIAEFGLLTAAGTLCARKNRATPIYKSAAVTLAGSWTIQF